MRRSLGVLVLAAMLLPTGLFTASSAAAASGTTCRSLTGRATFSPRLPALSDGQTVRSTVTLTGTFVGCSGGVTSATFTSTYKAAASCSTLLASGPTPSAEPATTTWNTQHRSTGTIQLHASMTNPTKGTLHGTTAAGPFKGLRTTATYTFALRTKGGCTVVPLKEISILGGPVRVR